MSTSGDGDALMSCVVSLANANEVVDATPAACAGVKLRAACVNGRVLATAVVVCIGNTSFAAWMVFSALEPMVN